MWAKITEYKESPYLPVSNLLKITLYANTQVEDEQPVVLIENWKEEYKKLIEYLYNNLSDDVKKDVFFEIIFMTYSYIHTQINKEAFPNSINLFNTSKLS